MANFVKVAKTNEIAAGERKVVEADGHFIAIFNVADTYYAIADICTHDDGPLAEGEVRDYIIECPRHGGTFDIRTGEALSFPAVTPAPSYMVRVQNDDILVELE